MLKQKQDEIKQRFEDKIENLKVYVKTKPFLQLHDTLKFNCGVIAFALFVYTMGRYPDDYFLKLYIYILPICFIIRYFHFKRMLLHFFMFDFCYYGSSIVVCFIAMYPKSEVMYRLSFIYSAGILGISTAVFSNALVFHKLRMELISLVLHLLPMVVLWNIR